MIKILATTDMSANSRAGMKYAIQLAQQTKAKITFLHVHMVLRASSWSESTYHYYIEKEKAVLKKDMDNFIKSVYRSLKIEVPKFTADIVHTFDTAEAIMSYAEKNAFNYICQSARGAGGIAKLFGTVTGKLISSSKVPVLSIPPHYKFKALEKILYASDFTNYENELREVIKFAKPLNLQIEMLHLAYHYQVLTDEQLIENQLRKKLKYPIDLHYQQRDIDETVLKDIETAVKKSKPSVVAMFTKQSQSFFDRFIMGSNSKNFSFKTKVPLLIFPKKV